MVASYRLGYKVSVYLNIVYFNISATLQQRVTSLSMGAQQRIQHHEIVSLSTLILSPYNHEPSTDSDSSSGSETSSCESDWLLGYNMVHTLLEKMHTLWLM